MPLRSSHGNKYIAEDVAMVALVEEVVVEVEGLILGPLLQTH